LQHGRDATVISPFAVGSLVVDFGLPGVVWPMAGPLVVQIIAVYFRGRGAGAGGRWEGHDPKA
jgi:hypothetical protein